MSFNHNLSVLSTGRFSIFLRSQYLRNCGKKKKSFCMRKTFDFLTRTCYSICNMKKAVTKTVRQTRFSENRRLVQDDKPVPKTHHFRAGGLKYS